MQTYKIIGFDKTTGSISIEFDPQMVPTAVDLPIKEDGTYPVGEELDAYVQGFIPTWFLERKQRIAAGIANEAEITALVQEPIPAPVDEAESVDIQAAQTAGRVFAEYETEKAIAKALLKWGILTQDPTEIKSTTL